MNRSGAKRPASTLYQQYDDEVSHKPPELISDVQRLISAHPVVSINAALLMGVAVGWLAKRL